MFKKLFLIFISVIILFSFIPAFALAAVPLNKDLYPEGAATISGDRPSGASQGIDLEESRVYVTQRIVSFILGFAGIVAIFFIINNAWFLIASGGKEETITQHKKGLMWAIVGLILIILSYSIIRFIISIPFDADQPQTGPSQNEQGPAGESQSIRSGEGGGGGGGGGGGEGDGGGAPAEEAPAGGAPAGGAGAQPAPEEAVPGVSGGTA